MLTKLGEKFTHIFLKFMPDAFVFAMLLTLVTGCIAFFWMGSEPMTIVVSWFDGFFDLLAFGMQIVLIIVTGYCIALSPIVGRGIDKLTNFISTPKQVYFFVMLIGVLLCFISFGWIVITCVLARELALRVKGVNYPFLIACVYFSGGSWVCGLSSSIPLLLNTEDNYLINNGVLDTIIPTSYTLGSTLNMAMIFLFVIVVPIVMVLLLPKAKNQKELKHLLKEEHQPKAISISEEAKGFRLPFKAVSDTLNNSKVLQFLIVIMGFAYIIYHFKTKGLDLNFNIMIFIFLIVGLLLHQSPMRYSIAMKRASSNISDIIFQYPFYAGIMGIMLHTGLGKELGQLMASVATQDTYPFFAYLTGGVVNFAIPSAGGEFTVIGPTIIEAVKEIGSGLPADEITAMISRASMSVAFGESLSNLMQPFFLLLVLPVMGAGVKLQARDVMGYLVLPFIIFFIIQALMVLYIPM